MLLWLLLCHDVIVLTPATVRACERGDICRIRGDAAGAEPGRQRGASSHKGHLARMQNEEEEAILPDETALFHRKVSHSLSHSHARSPSASLTLFHEMNTSVVRALVTGAASGLGLATARVLASKGAHVVLLDLPSSQGGDRAAEIGANARFHGGRVCCLVNTI